MHLSAKKCAADNETLKSDICSLNCRLESVKNQRNKAEGDARDLCKQLDREKKNQRIERDEFCKKMRDRGGQTTSELSIGYESKTHTLLNTLRNQFKGKICIAGVDIIRNIIAQGDGGSQWTSTVDEANAEIEATIEANIKIVSELQGKLTECSSKRNSMRVQVGRHQRQHEKNIAQIRRMQQELVALLNQYQDLIDVKLLLDFELAAYNQMLAIEEYRFNVSNMCQKTLPKRGTSAESSDSKRAKNS